MPIKSFDTLLQALSYRAVENAKKPAFIFDKAPCSFSTLWQEINRFAAYTMLMGMDRGDRFIIALPNSKDFFIAFYGVQRAGGIAVPLFPDSGLERIHKIADLCDARAIIMPSSSPAVQRDRLGSKNRINNRSIITVEESKSNMAEADFPEIHPDDIAFIQYTSGSTGNPKGVLISHANIIDNIEQMISGMGITKKDIFVSWLPVYHDMGLILMTMVPFYLAAQLILMTSTLANIRKWMESIYFYRGTFTAAPDFAYRMSLLYIRDPSQYDLSSLRVALNAAEPVRARTVHDFEEKFGLKNVMSPAYGLAEATVGVSMWPPQTPIKVDNRGFVSFGKGFPEVEMKILSKNRLAGSDVVGEILVKSPANAKGYFNNVKETSRLFWGNDYIRTGDLGYFDEQGDFYIVGRKKNIIIHAGQNISPQEVEEIVDGLPFVRYSAAVGIEKGQIYGEQVYIFAEIRGGRTSSEERLKDMTVEIVQNFHSRLGFRPGRVYLLAPRSIPLTYNGKIMYSSLKKRYLDGSLRQSGKIFFPDY